MGTARWPYEPVATLQGSADRSVRDHPIIQPSVIAVILAGPSDIPREQIYRCHVEGVGDTLKIVKTDLLPS